MFRWEDEAKHIPRFENIAGLTSIPYLLLTFTSEKPYYARAGDDTILLACENQGWGLSATKDLLAKGEQVIITGRGRAGTTDFKRIWRDDREYIAHGKFDVDNTEESEIVFDDEGQHCRYDGLKRRYGEKAPSSLRAPCSRDSIIIEGDITRASKNIRTRICHLEMTETSLFEMIELTTCDFIAVEELTQKQMCVRRR